MTSSAINTSLTKITIPYESVVPGMVCAVAITGIVLSIIGLMSISYGQINAISRLGIAPNASILGLSTLSLILGLVVLTSLTKRKIDRECQQIKQNHEQALTKITNQNERLTQQQVTLKQSNTQFRAEIKDLQEEKGKLEQQLSTLHGEYLQAKETIQQKAAAEKEVKQLEQSKARLQKEIEELKNIPEHLVTAKSEMKRLEEQISARKTELANLEYNVSQKDYKTKCNYLHGEISRLKSELQRKKDNANYWYMRSHYKH